MRRIRTIAALSAALLLVAAAPASRDVWTRAWTASMWKIPGEPMALENVTIRSEIRVAASGGAIRLRLSNEFGDDALAIGGATVQLPGGAPVAVTFGGLPTARIGAGAPIVSDPIALPVKAFDLVSVSVYLPEKARVATVHHSVGDQTQISAPGDHRNEAFVAVRTDRLRPLIAGIDVRSAKARPIVVAYGDSITDNVNCLNKAPVICRWSDVLARRFAKAGMPQVVVTQAISGNRILTPGTGPSALARFDRDVLAVPGVTHVVMLEGINDIGNSGLTRNGVTNPVITTAELIAGYRQLLVRAHERGIKVIAMTILPFEGAGYYSPEREAMRMAVNDWFRSSREFDGVIDMEKVVADPGNPRRIASDLQGGDNLHPDGRGETKMGEAIDLRLFR